MPSLRWSPLALLDVHRLHNFLSSKNPDAAKRAVKSIKQGGKVLGLQPGIGRPIDDMPEQFREWPIDFGDAGYVARYRIDGDVVVVLAVRHQKESGDF